MIEALVGMLMIAVLMLSTGWLQASSLKVQHSAGFRFQAVALAGELGEMMESNPVAANAGTYVLATTSKATSSAHDCRAKFCTPAELASHDLAQWSARVAASMPLVDMAASRQVGADGLSTYTITLRWQEAATRDAALRSNTGPEVLSLVLQKVVRNVAP